MPADISEISRVIFAWRALLNASVRSPIISSDASLAFFMASMRADCSEAPDSSAIW